MRNAVRIAALAAAALAGRTPPPTIDDIVSSALPNIFSVPGIDAVPDHGRPSGERRIRRLQAREDGTFPHVVSEGAYEAVNPLHGFLSLKYNTMLPNTTVNVEQYTDIWTAAASVECQVVGDLPYVDDNSVVQKTKVSMMNQACRPHAHMRSPQQSTPDVYRLCLSRAGRHPSHPPLRRLV